MRSPRTRRSHTPTSTLGCSAHHHPLENSSQTYLRYPPFSPFTPPINEACTRSIREQQALLLSAGCTGSCAKFTDSCKCAPKSLRVCQPLSWGDFSHGLLVTNHACHSLRDLRQIAACVEPRSASGEKGPEYTPTALTLDRSALRGRGGKTRKQ